MTESDIEEINRHRLIWQKKAPLRKIYNSWFDRLLQLCGSAKPILEVGSGPGFLRERYPKVLATDVLYTPWIDLVADASQLPFADESLGSCIGLDVFHHLAAPGVFLKEIWRVLKHGGRLVLLEPWISWFGFFIYRFCHDEDCDLSVDMESPFEKNKKAFEGNAALPYLWFSSPNKQNKLTEIGFELELLQPIVASAYLGTCGFKSFCLMTEQAISAFNNLDGFLMRLSNVFATRSFIVIRKCKINY